MRCKVIVINVHGEDMDMNSLQQIFKNTIKSHAININTYKQTFGSSKVRFVSIDDFFPLELSEHLENVFPEPSMESDLKSKRYQIGKHIISKDSGNLGLLDSSLVEMLKCFKSECFLDFIKEITGIQDLRPDFDDWGAGIHQSTKGGFLKKHIDSPYKENENHLFRRVNTILYLNSNWEDHYNGNLEIWDDEKRIEPAFSIKPIINRLAIFETSSFSWHGFPQPLECPAGKTRKSIAQFYYSKDNGLQDISQDNPLWSAK